MNLAQYEEKKLLFTRQMEQSIPELLIYTLLQKTTK